MNVDELAPKEREFTDEEKAQIEEFYEELFKSRFKTKIATIQKYLSNKKITIDEAIKEVQEKKSGLPSLHRDMLLSIKEEVLQKWFKNEDSQS